MKIQQFEEIQAWQLARELTSNVYHLTKKQVFPTDAEGFDTESKAEFLRFLSCAQIVLAWNAYHAPTKRTFIDSLESDRFILLKHHYTKRVLK